jgi:serine-type anaerobic sulfatase-maturating enzyme
MATLIVKVTEKCNSNCYYCDVVRKQDSGSSMGLDTLEVVFERVNEYLTNHPEETIEILWHGGEPLLVGTEYYEKAIVLQERYCKETMSRVSHSMQSNLLCLTEKFIPVLARLGINSLGTSYDPEPYMRGTGAERRTDLYNARFFSSLRMLERHDIGWGIIYVVTQKSLLNPQRVFFHLTNLLLSGGINLNPVLIYDKERKDVAITAEEYAAFLGSIFPLWWKNRHRYPDIEPFRSFVRNIVDGHTSLSCVDSGSCTYHHINIAPDGQTSQCGRSGDWGLLQYGSIHDLQLEDILCDPQRKQLDQRVVHLRDNECANCRFWDLCHGGCPLDAWSEHGSFMHRSEWCDAKRIFLEQYFEPVTGECYNPHVSSVPSQITASTITEAP